VQLRFSLLTIHKPISALSHEAVGGATWTAKKKQFQAKQGSAVKLRSLSVDYLLISQEHSIIHAASISHPYETF
jgi:hypothetical protein